jgi:putative nucleotidyltransferase with HDIG domain
MNQLSDVGEVRLSEVLAALSHALDITEGQPMGHTARACAIGMRIADQIGLDDDAMRSSLFYALLLKDSGCSSNAARVCALFGHDDLAIKREHKTVNHQRLKEAIGYVTRNVQPEGSVFQRAKYLRQVVKHGNDGSRALIRTRCERGAAIARTLGFDDNTADAIHSLDEYWNGKGYPEGLAGEEIPLLARILNIAQTAEVFGRISGSEAMFDVIEERRGTWWDPSLVDAVIALRSVPEFWRNLYNSSSEELVAPLEPQDRVVIATDEVLDRVAEAFAQVIDAKSPFTVSHSLGVATIAVGIARERGLDQDALRDMWRAGLLHDIGKLGVSNTILDKPGKLDAEEWAKIREHPRHTVEILNRIPAFRGFADMAGAHHERLDGSGYHLGLTGDQLSVPARILAVADVCDALLAERPYRAALPAEQVIEIIESDAGTKLDAESIDAMKIFLETYVAEDLAHELRLAV